MAGQIDEARSVCKHAFDQFECVEQRVFDFIELAAFAAPERGWVEQNAVVAVAAFDFAGEEFVDVVDDPADGVLRETVELGILACPLHHAFRGVDVAAVRAAFGSCKCGTAGVGEQVEEFERLFAFRCFGGEGLGDPVPHVARFGEYAEVAEVGGGEFQGDVVDGGLPGFWEFVAAAPLQALFSGEKCVG